MLPVVKWRDNLSTMVDEFFGRDRLSDFLGDRTGISTPAVNIKEGENDFQIEVAAPGLDKKDFRINVDNGVLNISSEKEEKKEDKDDEFVRREFSYSTFSRSFSIPESVDADKIKANHKDGVLTITMPKKEESKQKPPKQIEIS
ncbi:MAG: Hsp20/alpha crystallin family protein [Bacteroidales bacterium]